MSLRQKWSSIMLSKIKFHQKNQNDEVSVKLNIYKIISITY